MDVTGIIAIFVLADDLVRKLRIVVCASPARILAWW